MKRLILMLCVMLPTICMAQGRLIKGVVFDVNGTPFKGATVSVEGSTESFVTPESGEFEMTVSPYVKFVVANAEGYLTSRAEIDGSFLVFRLQVDKKYLENKLKAEEEARKAAEREAQAKLKAEEEARKAAEREAQAKLKAEEEARKAAEREAQAKLKAEEDARKAAEREAQAKLRAEENARLAAEREAQAKLRAEENARLVAEREAKRTEAALEAKLADTNTVNADEDDVKAKVQASAEIETCKPVGSVSELGMVDDLKAQQSTFHSIGLSAGVYTDFHWVEYISLSYTYTKRYNYVTWGVGAGLSFHPDGDTKYHWNYYTYRKIYPKLVQIPLFLYLRTNANMYRKCTPFFALSAGVDLALPLKEDLYIHDETGDLSYPRSVVTSQLFANPQVGVDIRMASNNMLSVSLGLQCSSWPYVNFDPSNYDITTERGFVPLLNLNIGYTF